MSTTIADTKGLVASISLTGQVTYQFSQCFTELRSYNETQLKYFNVEYKQEYGVLVESARDAVAMHALQENYDWVLQIDADATFPRDTLQRLLETAYLAVPDAGVVGAYSQLKPFPHLPTIDTGSGTWEEHYPGEGILPVIRTGAHCFLTKTWVFHRIGSPPWFRTRSAGNPMRAMLDVDNYARTMLDGRNPLAEHPEWETLREQATKASPVEAPVGEDSAFFDRLRYFDVPVYVDTDLVTGHVGTQVIKPADFAKAMNEHRELKRAALGIA